MEVVSERINKKVANPTDKLNYSGTRNDVCVCTKIQRKLTIEKKKFLIKKPFFIRLLLLCDLFSVPIHCL